MGAPPHLFLALGASFVRESRAMKACPHCGNRWPNTRLTCGVCNADVRNVPGEPEPLVDWKKIGVAVVAGMVLLGLFALCSTAVKKSGDAERDADKNVLACAHFTDVVTDIGNGLLTPSEVRQKLKEVYDDASIASPAVLASSRRLLAAYTADPDDTGPILAAMGELKDACLAG